MACKDRKVERCITKERGHMGGRGTQRNAEEQCSSIMMLFFYYRSCSVEEELRKSTMNYNKAQP